MRLITSPKEWADKYKGKFDEGWDVYREKTFARQKELGIMPKDAQLSRHDPDVQEWAKLPADERKLYARMMEVFAGFCEHMDHHVGRLIDFLEQMGELDNTLIMFISDNGASSEGGPNGSVNENKFFNNVPDDLKQNLAAIDDLGGPKYFNHYAWGWTHAGNTPFKRWKRETYRGGVSDPVHRSLAEGHQDQGQGLPQFAHAIDMVPTVLEALRVEAPTQVRGVTQSPIEGVSFAHVFQDAEGGEPAQDAIFRDVRAPVDLSRRLAGGVSVPWNFVQGSGPFFGSLTLTEDMLRELDAKNWELYDLSKDPTETTDLAASNRPKLIEMIALWYTEAGKYNVFPLDSRGTMRFADERPELTKARKTYVYYPGHADDPGECRGEAPQQVAQSHCRGRDSQGRRRGRADLPRRQCRRLHAVREGQEAPLRPQLCRRGGISSSSRTRTCRRARSRFAYEFEKTGEPDLKTGKGAAGKAQLYINKKLVGETKLPYTVPLALGIGSGVFIGRNSGSPVSVLYGPPFEFTGVINEVTVDISGKLIDDSEEQKHARAKTRDGAAVTRIVTDARFPSRKGEPRLYEELPAREPEACRSPGTSSPRCCGSTGRRRTARRRRRTFRPRRCRPRRRPEAMRSARADCRCSPCICCRLRCVDRADVHALAHRKRQADAVAVLLLALAVGDAVVHVAARRGAERISLVLADLE